MCLQTKTFSTDFANGSRPENYQSVAEKDWGSENFLQVMQEGVISLQTTLSGILCNLFIVSLWEHCNSVKTFLMYSEDIFGSFRKLTYDEGSTALCMTSHKRLKLANVVVWNQYFRSNLGSHSLSQWASYVSRVYLTDRQLLCCTWKVKSGNPAECFLFPDCRKQNNSFEFLNFMRNFMVVRFKETGRRNLVFFFEDKF